MENSRPRIILNAAMSVDGKIATFSGDSNLSSQKDRIRVHKLSSKVDAVLVGKNTVLRDDPMLTVRFTKGKNPTRVILDSTGSIPLDSKILQTCSDIRTIMAVSKKIPAEKLAQLKNLPIEIIMAGRKLVHLRLLMWALSLKDIKTVLVEGGGTVNWAFIKDGLFDELYLTISPVVIGGKSAISLVQGKGFETIQGSVRLYLNSVSRLEDQIVLHYTRLWP